MGCHLGLIEKSTKSSCLLSATRLRRRPDLPRDQGVCKFMILLIFIRKFPSSRISFFVDKNWFVILISIQLNIVNISGTYLRSVFYEEIGRRVH